MANGVNPDQTVPLKEMSDSVYTTVCFCLFDLILYVPSTIFQLNRDGSSWVEPELSWDKGVLLKDHSAVTPVRLEPAASRSRVKHSTTEPLHYSKTCVKLPFKNRQNKDLNDKW